ncbi:PREDICTED: probable C-mannosyltransferase DPY19L2 [Dipodomys ordii]|uniref:Probable C-mannosyltransferase DPY19L2 n=1 Tax=Dipodomys ordii TaxID=10020 RepID=A0A1S3GRL3_DIPOR|nr:PREDICTED: probable C-mannosyltransferase DPY19L2 [Dipodomys ordii]
MGYSSCGLRRPRRCRLLGTPGMPRTPRRPPLLMAGCHQGPGDAGCAVPNPSGAQEFRAARGSGSVERMEQRWPPRGDGGVSTPASVCLSVVAAGGTRGAGRAGGASAGPHARPEFRGRRDNRASRNGGGNESLRTSEGVHPPPLLLGGGGGNLPGGSRDYSPRRIRHLNAQNYANLEAVARSVLQGRFQFLHSFAEQFRQKMLRLQTRRFSSRTTWGIAAFVGVLHWIHLVTLFENDRHFSHLSSLEREMTFRTEMGLYYSYFKTIIDAPSFLEGLWMIMNDRLTEYPLVINTVKRFHLYPEVVIAYWYRIFMGIMHLLGIEAKTCWNVTRLEPLNEVMSCEGMSPPPILGAQGEGHQCLLRSLISNTVNTWKCFCEKLTVFSVTYNFFLFSSGTQLGGIVTVLCYFFNHGEATRVMWTPPLRESFSYPFLVLQMYILTRILRSSLGQEKYYLALCLANTAFMLPWQFAQFILFTQIASLFPMYVVGYIEPSKFQKIIYMNMVSVVLCFILMFGNPMYLTSYYSSSLLMTWAIILKRSKIQRMGVSELNFWLVQGGCWWCGTIILKFLTSKVFGVSDHIRLSDLIAARILRYTDFDTLIYTCAPEFDFMERATPLRYTKTLLLPIILVVTYFILKKTVRDVLWVLSANSYQRKQLLEHGELVFHTLQLLAFTALAILIMRLKLFLTPHMCVMASLMCSKRLFGWIFYRVNFENIVFGILTVMSLQGCTNLHNQWSIIGEFTNLPQEELIQWIKYNTRPDAVFAGAMPTMASIKLSTLHPIVNHPHYEDADLRARTKTVYSAYSRKSAKEVRDKLSELHVNYYVLEEAWCVVRTKPGCSMLEIWDVEDPSNAAKPPLCSLLLKDSRPYFTTVFQNSMYRVLKVN